ncbi:MAG: hemolysin family protein [Kiritimatiellaeota bacterium]|nr:hemolysin family protein [Kiritimatiellota bacterium]
MLSVIFIITLVLLGGFFSASEFAIIALNDAKVRKMAEEGNHRARRLLRFMDNPGRFLATIQVGNTLTGFFASALTASVFAGRVSAWVLRVFPKSPESAVHSTVMISLTILLAFFSLVFGELVPKRIAMKYSEPISMHCAGILLWISSIARPFVWLLNATSGRLLRLIGIDPDEHSKEVSEEEIRMMVDIGEEKGAIDAAEKEMIENVFEFNNKTAADIMIHRRDIMALSLDSTHDECLAMLRECRFSRLPVYSGTIDDIVGILHVRDYFIKTLDDATPSLGPLLRPPVFVPETIRTDILFRDLQRRKQSMAIVLDEHGGTSGLVALEDLLEEIVGEIHSEYDAEEPTGEWERLDEHSYRIRGGTPVGDVAQLLNVTFPENDYHTLGGLIFGTHRIIPAPGTILKLPDLGLLMTVEKMDGRRVDSVIVRKIKP